MALYPRGENVKNRGQSMLADLEREGQELVDRVGGPPPSTPSFERAILVV